MSMIFSNVVFLIEIKHSIIANYHEHFIFSVNSLKEIMIQIQM